MMLLFGFLKKDLLYGVYIKKIKYEKNVLES